MAPPYHVLPSVSGTLCTYDNPGLLQIARRGNLSLQILRHPAILLYFTDDHDAPGQYHDEDGHLRYATRLKVSLCSAHSLMVSQAVLTRQPHASSCCVLLNPSLVLTFPWWKAWPSPAGALQDLLTRICAPLESNAAEHTDALPVHTFHWLLRFTQQ